jgi:D-alanine-D-alanine ligase
MSTTAAARYGRVAVVMGGDSSERQVSLWSGQAVLAALQQAGVDARGVDGIPALLSELQAGRFDRVFVILHGPGGEDGVVQGALEALRVPYTGSGVLGSAVGMDKLRSKYIWQSIGIPSAPFISVPADWSAAQLIEQFGLPLVIKPSAEGSTFGVTLCRDSESVERGMAEARRFPGAVLAERLIEGEEYTIAILGEQALPIIHVVPQGKFYDFDAKYLSDQTEYRIPSGLSAAQESALQALAVRAFLALGASGWGRVDVMVDAAGAPYFLEINTNPGMTSHSLVPKAAAAVGIDFATLCLRILDTSIAREVPHA